MAYYLKINGNDYSMYVNMLKVSKQHNYKSLLTAAGNTLVKYINSKYILDVGIIPLDDAAMARLLADIGGLEVTVSFRNPETNLIEENVKCIIPMTAVEYYTIQSDKVRYKAFNIAIQQK
jgi:hypothetical protein